MNPDAAGCVIIEGEFIICGGSPRPYDVRHLASTIHCVDGEIFEWLKRRERRRKGSRANPDNRQGHRSADTQRTAKHHREI